MSLPFNISAKLNFVSPSALLYPSSKVLLRHIFLKLCSIKKVDNKESVPIQQVRKNTDRKRICNGGVIIDYFFKIIFLSLFKPFVEDDYEKIFIKRKDRLLIRLMSNYFQIFVLIIKFKSCPKFKNNDKYIYIF